jgi:hypothetical protein
MSITNYPVPGIITAVCERRELHLNTEFRDLSPFDLDQHIGAVYVN